MTTPQSKQNSSLASRFGLSRLLAWRNALAPLVLALALGGQYVLAQSPPLPPPPPSMATTPAPTKYFLPRGNFSLPVKIDDRVRSGLKLVQLYYKTDPDQRWELRESAPPTQTSFSVKLD